jgi:hypothetical protein
MSRTLNDSLAQLVSAKKIAAKDAMRAAYARGELHELISHIR